MKKSFIYTVVAVSSIFLLSCLEDETIPIPLPPPPPQTAAVDLPPPPPPPAESVTTPAPAIVSHSVPTSSTEPTPTPTVKELPPPPAWATSDIEQLSSGIYTIQVGVYPSEKEARNTVKKLARNEIDAYYRRFSNPAQLQGSYYRVRVGYFNGKSVAEEFARTKLTPLNYKWWVDMSRNDAIGTQAKSVPPPVQVPKETSKAPAKTAPVESSKPSSQEEEAKKAALEAAKADYKAFAEKADKESKAKAAQNAKVKAPPPPPPPKKR